MSAFHEQRKQFTVWLICGSVAHVHHSAHPVNLFPDAYAVSCNVWDSYLSFCLTCVEKLLHLMTDTRGHSAHITLSVSVQLETLSLWLLLD